MISPRWQCGRPQSSSPHKDEQQSTIKNSSGRAQESTSEMSTQWNRSLRMTTQKRRKDSFIFPASSHPQAGASPCQQGTAWLERLPFPENGQPSGWPVSPEEPLWFYQTQRLAKPRLKRWLGTGRQGKGSQYSPIVGATMVPRGLLCRGPQQRSPPRKPTASSTPSGDPRHISLFFTPQVFMFPDANHLSPSHLFTPASSQHPVYTSSQPRLPWLHACKITA